MQNKTILTAVLALTLLGVGTLAATQVYAQESSFINPMAQKFAERFGLNQTDVQNFFQEQHAARQEQMQATREERLNQLVAEGKLTEEQKAQLLTKMQEHHTEMEEHREEMQNWATENGIDLSLLHMGGAKHGRGLHRHME
ncbi:MAG: hypothetical protein R3B92_02710 [Patescibacteria group bacterium]|uniref:DUF2680 domain-containing protein n=1 Tax=candidate division WWE3 bacterium TaxID=2053526 RepID=A0A955EDZ6_UNCKA|nr:hypothetical protein [candidate division WWE3 bacterium]